MSGRGQPPKIGPERYGQLLELLESGLSMPAAAKQMGVRRSTLYNLAGRVPEMADRMRAARAAGKARHVPSESCYVNNGCRSPECTAAATEARVRRRDAVPAPVTALPTPAAGPTVYELLDDGPLADSA